MGYKLRSIMISLAICEGGNSKPLRNIQQDTKKRYKKGYPERQDRELGKVNGRKQGRERLLKNFFPAVERRLEVNRNLSPKVTTIMTGHGNIRSCLQRLKTIGSP
jgi:hypothetical protein